MSRESSGYSTNKGLASGPYQISFELDYSDYDRGIKEAQEATRDLGRELKAVGRYINAKGGRSKYGQVRITEGDLNMFAEQVSKRLLPAGTVEMQVKAKQAMTPVAGQLRDLMKYFVNRVDTGTMKREIRYKMESSGSIKRLRIDVGWVRMWYKYFDYQEYGTQYIPPMKALFNTRLRGEKMFQSAVNKFYRDYLTKGGKGY